ncbi:MAG: hypothetical protein RBT15_04835 [Gudongella sp.]|jgi:hypothetical protein|nr:hypothetical protein [Gudongella sp.]
MMNEIVTKSLQWVVFTTPGHFVLLGIVVALLVIGCKDSQQERA